MSPFSPLIIAIFVQLIQRSCGYASPESTVTVGGGDGGNGVGVTVTLTQSDFDNGAYIINTPGKYTFQEDIEFRPAGTLDPSSPETWMFPDITTAPYNKSPFRLGHFAGIVIQADGVTIDLNGKTFSQSEEHALMQRFFALIELASSPFKPNVGPASFAGTADFIPGSNVVIENGKLGRSSHHAIHGNNNVGVTLRNLDISDFEVAGIALNAVDELVVDTVTVHSTRADVPANGRLSAAIFLLQAVSQHLTTVDSSALSTEASALTTAQTNLRASVYSFLNDGTDTQVSTGALFASSANGVPDASLVAGIMIHGDFTVGGFAAEQPADFSSNIDLKNVIIRNLKVSPGEIGALTKTSEDGPAPTNGNVYTSNANAHDPVGAIFDIDFITNSSTGEYVSNPLAELQIAFADYANKCITLTSSGCTTMGDSSQANLLNRNTIGEAVVHWAMGTGSELTMNELKSVHKYKVSGNHDIMFHKQKGIVGLKLDGASDVKVDNIVVSNLENVADGSRRSWLAVQEDPHYQYTGFATRGLSIASSVNVDVDKISVRDSTTGIDGVDPICVDTLFEFQDVSLKNVQAEFDFFEDSDEATAQPTTAPTTEEDQDGDGTTTIKKKIYELSVSDLIIVGVTFGCTTLLGLGLVFALFMFVIIPRMKPIDLTKKDDDRLAKDFGSPENLVNDETEEFVDAAKEPSRDSQSVDVTAGLTSVQQPSQAEATQEQLSPTEPNQAESSHWANNGGHPVVQKPLDRKPSVGNGGKGAGKGTGKGRRGSAKKTPVKRLNGDLAAAWEKAAKEKAKAEEV